jgi:hypothetical protein
MERRHIAMRKTIIAALFASSAAVFTLPAAAQIYVDIAPPAPRYEVVPAPRAGYVWAPGYWDYRGHRHVWVKGHFERERKGYYWHPNRWVQHDGRWQLEKGRWDRERFAENRDRDRDGVPNRVDRDRDGDGVPNRMDRRPDNPNRQ